MIHLSLSIRLISDYPQRWRNQDQLTINLWKFVPFQAIAELYGHGSKNKETINVVWIKNTWNRPVKFKQKKLNHAITILHWLIISEIRALEAFVLSNSQEMQDGNML